jgi:hypothetical protein
VKPSDEELELGRLLAEQHSPLTSLVAELRDRGPDATELASLASRLALQGVDVTSRVATAHASAAWKKWALAATGGASAIIIWLALPGPGRSPAVAVDSSGSTHAPQDAHALTTARSAARDDRELPGTARGLRPNAPSPVGAATGSVVAGQTLPPSAPPLATSSPLPAERSAAPSVGTRAPANPGAAAARPLSGGSNAAQAEANDSAVRAEASAAPSEMDLLRDARLALRQSPERALELAERHAQVYPQGRLTQERELLAISALVSLGRRTAALSRGARFERSFPSSPYRKQLGELLR